MTTFEILQADCRARGFPVLGGSLVALKHTATLCGVTTGTMHLWRAAGRGPPSTKVEGRRYYRLADIADTLNGAGGGGDYFA